MNNQISINKIMNIVIYLMVIIGLLLSTSLSSHSRDGVTQIVMDGTDNPTAVRQQSDGTRLNIRADRFSR